MRRDREYARSCARPVRRAGAWPCARRRISAAPDCHRRRIAPPRRHASADSPWPVWVRRSAFSRCRHRGSSALARYSLQRIKAIIQQATIPSKRICSSPASYFTALRGQQTSAIGCINPVEFENRWDYLDSPSAERAVISRVPIHDAASVDSHPRLPRDLAGRSH